MRLWIVLILLTIYCSTLAGAAEIAGVNVPDAVALGAHNLVLNGAGIRSKFFVKVYIGALYLLQRTSDPATALQNTGPVAIHMHIVHSEIDHQKLVSAWRDGFEANLDKQELAGLAGQITRFYELFPTVHKGDVIRLDYDPGSGTTVHLNDKLQGNIEGEAFMHAWLRIWLGKKPADADLKEGMLGLD